LQKEYFIRKSGSDITHQGQESKWEDAIMYKVWNNFKTTLLMAGLMGICLAIGYLIGGQSALLPALVIGAVINLFSLVMGRQNSHGGVE
jgi:hypothetical protein